MTRQHMTRLDALRTLVSTPRDHTDQGRIGHRVIYAKPDATLRGNKPKTFTEWARLYSRRNAS